MSEYIIEIPDDCFPSFDIERDMYYPDERDSAMPIKPIVRCRDCEHLNIVGKCPCGFWALENLDGFCAWGERKVLRDE